MRPEDIVALLTVINLSKQWPTLSAIHDAAMATLLEVNADAQKELTGAKAAKAKADAEAAAKLAQANQAAADVEIKKQADMAARARIVPIVPVVAATSEPESDFGTTQAPESVERRA